MRLRGYRRRKLAPGVTEFTQRQPMQRYETDAPWLTFRYRWSDRWTRLLGRAGIEYRCLICGGRERGRFRIPRFGPVPKPVGGQHPYRLEIKARHAHPGERGNPLLWALPLGNPAAFQHREADVLDVIRERVKPPKGGDSQDPASR